jgi:methylated-DNA-protein-cysteine methyltransferase-like protein
MFFKNKVISIIKKIPYGKVTTYGTVAVLAGNPRGARTVGWILASQSEKYNLPWQRVINRRGFISIKGSINSKEVQKGLLQAEGIEVSPDFMVNLKEYGWFGK